MMYLCFDCSDREPMFIPGPHRTKSKEVTHCYGKHDWKGPPGLIGGGRFCSCACASKHACQQCQGKRSFPPFTRQVCDFCNGTGKYQPRPEDIAAAEAEAKLLEKYERVGDKLRCKSCGALTDVIGSKDHSEWHERLGWRTFSMGSGDTI